MLRRERVGPRRRGRRRQARDRCSAPSAKSAQFRAPDSQSTLKTLDLADVVAGGDGFSGRRNAGIDSATGRRNHSRHPEEPVWSAMGGIIGRNRCRWSTACSSLTARNRPVQVDSAGHVFDGFTNSEGIAALLCLGAAGSKSQHAASDDGLAGGRRLQDRRPRRNPCACQQWNYLQPGRGPVRVNPGCKLLRFRAVGGSTYLPADLWVLVDGKLRFQQKEIDKWSGPFPIAMPIGEKDRFLTLASTTNRADRHRRRFGSSSAIRCWRWRPQEVERRSVHERSVTRLTTRGPLARKRRSLAGSR